MTKVGFIFLIILQSLMWIGNIQAQTELGNFSDLRLEVKPQKNNYLPFEPILFSYKISNSTSLPIKGFKVMSFRNSSTNLIIENIGQPRIIYQLSGWHSGSRLYLIQPNEMVEGQELLEFRLSDIFPEYGNYKLTFNIIGNENGEMISSNKIDITIQKPTGIDMEALAFIQKTQRSRFLGIFQDWVDFREKEPAKLLEEFVEKYSESVYGDYAVFYLGNYYKYQKKYDLAIKEFNKLKDKKDFAYSDKVESSLSEIEQDLIKIKLREREN